MRVLTALHSNQIEEQLSDTDQTGLYQRTRRLLSKLIGSGSSQLLEGSMGEGAIKSWTMQ